MEVSDISAVVVLRAFKSSSGRSKRTRLWLQGAREAGKRSLTRLAFHNCFGNGVNTFSLRPTDWAQAATHMSAQDYATPPQSLCFHHSSNLPPPSSSHSSSSSVWLPYIQPPLCKHSSWDHVTHRLKRRGAARSYIASICLLHVTYLCNQCGWATMRTCGWVGPPLTPHNTL